VLEFARHIHLSPAELVDQPDGLTSVLSQGQIQDLRQRQEQALEAWAKLRDQEVSVLTVFDDEYPDSLRSILVKKAPPLLFVIGNKELLTKPSVGFCGSREPSEKGLAVARECAVMATQEGINVVSGYAAGIDMTTHRAALETGGTTTIVLPEGLFHFRVKRDLKDQWDWNRIAVVSEYLPTLPWSVSNAMRRNQTICSLCKAMVLIEAREAGGSIEAGRTCLKLGIPLFAPVYEGMPESAKGNQLLLREGARSLHKSRTTQMPNLKGVFAAFQSNLHVAVS
jgi:DNA protecting protein DprA